MTDRAAGGNNPWHMVDAFFRGRLTFLIIMANLAGACIVTSYFMFFDPDIQVARITRDLIVIGVMFAGLVLIATVFLTRWQKDLKRFVQLKLEDRPVEANLDRQARKKILNLPYACSMTSGFKFARAV